MPYKDKNKHKAAMARWYKKNAKKLSDYRENNPEIYALSRAKKNAIDRNLEFDLELSDIKIPKTCPILGVELEYKTPYAASVDRIDSTKGYVKGNIQIISMRANTMKNVANPEELQAFARWVFRTYGDDQEWIKENMEYQDYTDT